MTPLTEMIAGARSAAARSGLWRTQYFYRRSGGEPLISPHDGSGTASGAGEGKASAEALIPHPMMAMTMNAGAVAIVVLLDRRVLRRTRMVLALRNRDSAAHIVNADKGVHRRRQHGKHQQRGEQGTTPSAQKADFDHDLF